MINGGELLRVAGVGRIGVTGAGRGRGGQHKVKPREGRPVVRLTGQLLDTYKRINDKYYTRQLPVPAISRKRVFNDGYDDESGNYIVRVGDVINDRYQIALRQGTKSAVLGKGSFGLVVYALDMLENLGVAVKIIKNQKHFHEQAKMEIDLLSKFLTVPLPCSPQAPVPASIYNHGRYLPCTQWVEYANTVRMLDTFTFRNHHCLVFELLPLSLYDMLKLSNFKGFSLQLVKQVSRNILQNLQAQLLKPRLCRLCSQFAY